MKWPSYQERLYRISEKIHNGVAPYLSTLSAVPPFRLSIVLTNKCNLHCSYCLQKDMLNKKIQDELSFEEWIQIFNQLSPFSVIDLLGGEVFVEPRFFEMLEAIKQKSLFVSITTNGSNLDRAKLEKLGEIGIHYLMISVDGLHSLHDTNRGKAGLFNKICHTLEELQQIKEEGKRPVPQVSIKTVLDNSVCPEIIQFIQFFERFPIVQEIKFSIAVLRKYQHSLFVEENLDLVFSEGANQYAYEPEVVHHLRSQLESIKAAIKHSRLKVSFSPELPRIDDLPDFLLKPEHFKAKKCRVPQSSLTLHPNGDITPCLTYKLGNIRDFAYDINQVLFSPQHLKFLQRQRLPQSSNACLSCSYQGHVRA